jgi:hypothetical protein
VKVPEGLLDDLEGFQGLPYVQYFYRYLPAGYSLANTSQGVEEGRKRPQLVGPPKPRSELHILREVEFHRLLKEKLTVRDLPGGYRGRSP